MQRIKQFDEHDDYVLFEESGEMEKPNVSKCDAERHIHYNPELLKIPMTFKVLSEGKIIFTATNAENTRTLSYSKNGGEWTTITSSTSGAEIPVEIGDQVAFKGNNSNGLSYYDQNLEYFNTFRYTTCIFNIFGNIMSLIDANNFPTDYEFKNNTYEQFGQLFYLSKVRSAKHLLLPAATLTPYCYYEMFRKSSLSQAPLLLSTNLARGCYMEMFAGCINVTSFQPVLPATHLPYGAYCNFLNETGITTAPEIMATTTEEGHTMWNMFEGCESLVSGPSILRMTTLNEQDCRGMFKECYNLVNPPVISATTIGKQAMQYMFQNCRSLVNPPVLPATVIAESSYNAMFNNCWTLANIPSLPAVPTKNCYYRMFENCKALTSVNVGVAQPLAEGSYQLMFNGCTNLNTVSCPASDISATNCLTNWMQNVASTGTFNKNPNVTYPSGKSGIPENWTINDIQGTLPGGGD